MSKIPGFKTIKEFAHHHRRDYGTAALELRRGYCLWGDGVRRHPLYETWINMKQRCYYIESTGYVNYGRRGIEVCDSWVNNFQQFVLDMAPRPNGYTLDRIDNNKGYYKENCRWATKSEQVINRRNNQDFCIRKLHPNTYTLSVCRNYIQHHLGTYNNIEQARTVRDYFINLYDNGMNYQWFIDTIKRKK